MSNLTLDCEQLVALCGIVKRAQEAETPTAPAKRKRKPISSYPDYDKSVVYQYRRNPQASGAQRAVATGSVGAVLGALIARMVTDKPVALAAGAGIGGAIGAIPGFRSGKEEAESDNSKLNFLRRRMNINHPGELEALIKNPALWNTAVNPKD